MHMDKKQKKRFGHELTRRSAEFKFFKRKNLQSRYAAEVVDVSGEERQLMDFTDCPDKGVFNADVHAFTYKRVMERSSFFGGNVVKGDDRDVLEQSVDKAGSAASLDAVKKLVNRDGGYVQTILQIGFFEKIRS